MPAGGRHACCSDGARWGCGWFASLSCMTCAGSRCGIAEAMVRLDRVARVVLTAAAVGFLVYYVDPSAMMQAVADADHWWIAPAVALRPAYVWLDAVMCHKLFLRVRPATSFRERFGAMLAGYSLAFFTPGR